MNLLNRSDKENIEFPKTRSLEDIEDFCNFVKKYIVLENNLFVNKEEDDNSIISINLSSRTFRINHYLGEIIFKDTIFHIFPFPFDEINSKESFNLFIDNFNLYLEDYFNVKFKKTENMINYDKETCFEFLITQFIYEIDRLLAIKPNYSYIERNTDLNKVCGRIVFNNHVKNYINGKKHLLNCEYVAFSFDNNINQILKFCIKLFLNKTKSFRNKSKLKRLSIIFEEVSDINLKLFKRLIESIHFNALNKDYKNVILLAKIILRGMIDIDIRSNSQNAINFCFIFRMDILFEKFITNRINDYLTILNKEKSIYCNYPQYNDGKLFLDSNKFTLKTDNLIKDSNDNVICILDTKYKDINGFDNVNRDDIYQIVNYVLFYKSNIGILLYPLKNNNHFEIVTKTLNIENNFQKPKIIVAKIPFVLTKDEINKRDFSRLYKCFDEILGISPL